MWMHVFTVSDCRYSTAVVSAVLYVPRAVKDSAFRLQLLSGRRLICVRGRAETSEWTTPPASLLDDTSSSVSAVREGSTWTGNNESHDLIVTADCHSHQSHTHTHTHSLRASRSACVRQQRWRSRLSRCVRWARWRESRSSPPDRRLLQDRSNSRTEGRQWSEPPAGRRGGGNRWNKTKMSCHVYRQKTEDFLLRASRLSAVRPQACNRSVVREAAWQSEEVSALKPPRPPPSTSCVSWGLQETSNTQSLWSADAIPPERERCMSITITCVLWVLSTGIMGNVGND